MKYWIIKLLLTVLLSTGSQIIISCKANFDIPFRMINGLIIVEAEYDDVRGNFIVDTGSSDVILDDHDVEKTVAVTTLAASHDMGEDRIRNFRMGSIFHSSIRVLTADLESLDMYTEMDIAGILGTNAFAPKSVEIDFNKGILLVSEEVVAIHTYEKLYSVPFMMLEGVPVAEVSCGDGSYYFILDTGASSHFVDADLLHSHPSSYVATSGVRNVSTAFSSDNVARVVILDTLGVGDKSLEEVLALSMSFQKLNASAEHRIAGLISLSKLSSRVILDLKRQVLLYE